MLYDYDFANQIIDIPYGITEVLISTLISDIRDAEATAQGIGYGQIAGASGKESLGGSVSVGVTVNLLDNWQIRFAEGNYIAKVAGGNLVGGPAGDPIAYSSGVQVLLLQSAASTIVFQSTGSGLSQEQDDKISEILQLSQVTQLDASKGRKMQTNKAIISGDGLSVTLYEDDGQTLLHQFTVSANKKERTPV
jgi:hypothetical protein